MTAKVTRDGIRLTLGGDGWLEVADHGAAVGRIAPDGDDGGFLLNAGTTDETFRWWHDERGDENRERVTLALDLDLIDGRRVNRERLISRLMQQGAGAARHHKLEDSVRVLLAFAGSASVDRVRQG